MLILRRRVYGGEYCGCFFFFFGSRRPALYIWLKYLYTRKPLNFFPGNAGDTQSDLALSNKVSNGYLIIKVYGAGLFFLFSQGIFLSLKIIIGLMYK